MIIVENRQQTGFSLIEFVVVIILLGVLSVFALGKISNTDDFAARGFFDDTVNAVRFAQKLAISSGCVVQVNIGATGYSIFHINTTARCTDLMGSSLVKNPGNRANNYQNLNIPTGFSLTSTTTPFSFSPIGNLTAPGDIAVQMNRGAVTVNAFTVFSQTGLVQ